MVYLAGIIRDKRQIVTAGVWFPGETQKQHTVTMAMANQLRPNKDAQHISTMYLPVTHLAVLQVLWHAQLLHQSVSLCLVIAGGHLKEGALEGVCVDSDVVQHAEKTAERCSLNHLTITLS